jgi:DNA polymerase III delta prime subunit
MQEYLWTEKYRPKSIKETVLPDRYKQTFIQMVETGSIPNLVFCGRAGLGKTSIAKAMCEELGCAYMVINGSLDGTKDTLRNEIRDFASSMSMDGNRKFVILDEADGLTNAMQQALRNFMEEFSSNCGFILTCNKPHKIAVELHSRCTRIDFDIQSKEKSDIIKKMTQRLFKILKDEDVNFDKKTVLTLVAKRFPDFRKTLNDLQRYAVNGSIDTGILSDFDNILLTQLVDLMRERNLSGIRQFVSDNDIDSQEIYDKLFEIVTAKVKPPSAAHMVVLLAKYQDMATRAPNPDITLCAALLELAASMEWKD